MAVLLLDNFDSFTYNLYDYIASLGYEVDVVRVDAFLFDNIEKYSHLVLSPGPGLPNQSEVMMKLIQKKIGVLPIFGVCLGMQALALHLGDTLFNLETVKHGREQVCHKLTESVLLNHIDQQFKVGLYHSWAVRGNSDLFEITSQTEEGVIMSIENSTLKCFGVQFHPESIMTPDGKQILQNFLNVE